MGKPDILLIENFIADPQTLFESLLSSVTWDERIKARKTASFGVSYDYSGMTYPEVAMLPALVPICKNIQATLGFLPNNCLINYYPDGGSSMGYHSDSLEQMHDGTGVAIVSLGATRCINYKSKKNKHNIHAYPLPAGTLLYMDDEVQENWLHAIPKQDNIGARISLTFRHIV